MTGDEARALHERLFTLDTHCDTPTAFLQTPGWDFAERHTDADGGSQCDLPRLRDGGVDAMTFAVYTGQAARTPEAFALVHDRALRCFERVHEVAAANAHACGVVRTAGEALDLAAAGRRALFLSVENAYSIGLDAGNVEKFHRLGLRMLGLTHMLNNDLADASTDPRGPEWGGLSPLGREVVAECNRLGIVLDASHASDAVLEDLLEVSRAPVVLSHSGPRAVCDHARNVGDDLLRALAAKGGVMQINALAIALRNEPGLRRTEAIAEILVKYCDQTPTPEMKARENAECDRACERHPNPAVSLEDVVRHIEYAVQVMGPEHVGIGFDLDGGGGGFPGLRDVGDYPNVTRALLERGWSEENLARLWGLNTLRVLRAAEDGAAPARG